MGCETDGIKIYDNTGKPLSTSANFSLVDANPAPAIANVDNAGYAEIVIGRNVFTLEKDTAGNLKILDRFEGNLNSGTNGQGAVSCVGNLVGDSKQEIIARNPETGVDQRWDPTAFAEGTGTSQMSRA